MMKINQQGSALIIVIWAIAIIGVVVTFMYLRSEAELAMVNNMEQNARLRREAEKILNQCLELFLENENEFNDQSDEWFSSIATIQSEYNQNNNSCQTVIRVEDEGSKPNINTIREKSLQGLIDKDDSLDPLLDWRDADNEPRMDGAEYDYYQKLNPAYKPRNGFFSSLEELKMVKGGDALYQKLSPEVTVFGKINPNTISRETFSDLLHSYGGFDRNWIDRASEEFVVFREKNRFTQINDFTANMSSVTINIRDRLKPIFKFTGSCNPNMVSEAGLKVILKEAGYPDDVARDMTLYRNQQPFESQAQINNYLLSKNKNIKNPEDYFTPLTTLIRYRIWVFKGNVRFYLETVQERILSGTQRKWRAFPVYWRELLNQEAPEIPKETSESREDE